ncbi:hypothetical protein [Mucilaginibacter myungsuensis]|uniref:Uncharacterized protein n=1 Tax=Mucilaginibacter myungsuensis TaxID=649104 RepID=A0A929PW78_9SPHI|nr:hypothetical protein [Mucilaginibacter myungsuensis]MBE9661070.1 hypothetical protein [Mucilaginibacter myungsuensis]MDN3597214.1 hypothetical protein [Mucilaginibacter myungsuensis]
MKRKAIANVKFFTGLGLQAVLAVTLLFLGCKMGFTSVNLSDVNVTIGKIAFVSVQSNRGPKAVPGQKEFVFYIDAQTNGYWIYRSSGKYDDLLSKISAGTEVKVFYSQMSDQTTTTLLTKLMLKANPFTV